jgi:hypothetical protein
MAAVFSIIAKWPAHCEIHATPPGLWRLIRCFRIADALNATMREIGRSVPDFGLRAIRRLVLRFFVMALFPYPDYPENAQRSIGTRASFTQAFIKVT